jgi:hypothetical protein
MGNGSHRDDYSGAIPAGKHITCVRADAAG